MPTVYVEGLGNISFPESMSSQEIEAEVNRIVKQQAAPAAPVAPEMGNLEKFGRGALQSVKDLKYGLQQVGAEVGDMFTRPANPQARSRQILGGEPRTAPVTGPAGPLTGTAQRLRQEEERRRIENAPFMETGAGKAGYVAGSIGSLLVPGAALARAPGMVGAGARALTAPTTFRAAAAGGGLLGAAQPLAEDESRAASAMIGTLGGTVGQAVGRGVSRIAQPVTSAATPQVERAVQRLEQAGVPVDIAERMGSENLRAVRRFLTDNPISASVMKKGVDKTQSAFNTAALRLIGEQGDAAIPQVLAQADDRIGAVMDRVARQTGIKVDDRMLSELVALEDSARMTLEPAKLAPLQAQFNNILGKLEPGDSIPGDAYQRIRTLARQLGADSALAGVSKQLRETVDSALERSAGKEAAAALKLARKQYRNLERIKESMGNTETGDIPIAKLASATSVKRERGAALMGRGDADLARLSRSANTMRDTFPQSGTTPRAAIQALGAAIPAAGALGYNLYTGQEPTENVLGLGALGAATLFAPRGAARLYQSPAIQQYLMRGIQSPLARRALMSRGTRGISTYAPAAGLLSSED